MTIRMYLILVFATILAFAGIARAEESTILLRTRPMELKKFDIQKYLPQPQEEYVFQLEKLSEAEMDKLALQKFIERATKSKLSQCVQTYEFDYFAWASAGNSLFDNSEDTDIQKEHQRLYSQLRVYMINGHLTQRDPAETVDSEVAAYCENFASAQADVVSVQIEAVHAMVNIFGEALSGFAERF